MLSKEEIENKNELLRKISKEQYGDEWFIEKTILSYKAQQEKTYTFFRDDEQQKLLKKYNFCQKSDNSNMSLRRFTDNGEIEGWASESLAEELGLIQVDLNEFIWKFVQAIIKEKLQLEADKQKLIEKLEKDIEQHTFSDIEKDVIAEYASEILEIMKGENDEYKNNN